MQANTAITVRAAGSEESHETPWAVLRRDLAAEHDVDSIEAVLDIGGKVTLGGGAAPLFELSIARKAAPARRPKDSIEVFMSDAQGEYSEYAPGKYEVCQDCDGRGSHALHGIAITGDEWNGPDWDDDSREAYIRGDYDTVCPTCKGKRVVLVLDRQRATKAQIEAYDADLEAAAEIRAEERSERILMGDY